ncbi:MAG TPA: hypothetical protein VMD58_03375 [Acidobacteriaceae bacterium]|nr:hypothetical protein [Acidobacteriaceae bacterium]
MAKHKFVIALFKEGQKVGAKCGVCGLITLYENGEIPASIESQECPVEKEDFSQAAARIVREATEKK